MKTDNWVSHWWIDQIQKIDWLHAVFVQRKKELRPKNRELSYLSRYDVREKKTMEYSIETISRRLKLGKVA